MIEHKRNHSQKVRTLQIRCYDKLIPIDMLYDKTVADLLVKVPNYTY